MKKKAIGFIALAMTLMATTVWGHNGTSDGTVNGHGKPDIRSIDPCDESGRLLTADDEMTGPNHPYAVGETAYFRIRLENVNSEESWTYPGLTANAWTFRYLGVGDSGNDWNVYRPEVGVMVSGKARKARIVKIEAAKAVTSGKGFIYTDIVCGYTVQPGDIALPLTLEVKDGYYQIYGKGYWELVSYERYDADHWDTVVATNTCSFRYPEDLQYASEVADIQANENGSWTMDLYGVEAGLYLKAVDFHSPEYEVAEGEIEPIQVDIVGGVNTNGAGTVYVKTKDLSAFEIAEKSENMGTIVINDGTELDGTYQWAKVTIPSGDDVTSFSFKVKGVTKDEEGTVYLSTTKEFVYGGSGVLATNFVKAAIRCGSPKLPYISVTIDEKASQSVTASSDYGTAAAKLTVTLSKPFTNDFTVSVTPSMAVGGDDPLGKFIGLSTYNEGGLLQSVTNVTFTAEEMTKTDPVLSKDLYIYALGASEDTDGIGKGIVFDATARAPGSTYFIGENKSATLYIKRSKPEIVSPVEDYEYRDLPGGVESPFRIEISDCYNDMKDKYVVEWYKTGSGKPQVISNLVADAEHKLTVNVKYNPNTDPGYTTRFRVQNVSGEWSELRTVNVKVNEAKTVSATVESPTGSAVTGGYYEYVDGAETELTVSFNLTEAYEDGTIYAFLVPQSEASSNSVICTAFSKGVAIAGGDMSSSASVPMTLLDGNAQTQPLEYEIVLGTSREWGEGEIITDYASKNLILNVKNRAPTISAVNMSGSAPVTTNTRDHVFGAKASVGVPKTFTLNVEDVLADLTNDVTAVWTFADPTGNAQTITVTTNSAENVKLSYTFGMKGRYECSVKLKDKDMSTTDFNKATTFDFKVDVLDAPAVQIVFPESESYEENLAGNRQRGYFNVQISPGSVAPLDVEITCTRKSTKGVFNIETNKLVFSGGVTDTERKVFITELDGTLDGAPFQLDVKVTGSNGDTEAANDDGIKYRDMYAADTKTAYAVNYKPEIVVPTDTGITNSASRDVDMLIPWRIKDVPADMTNGLTVTWTTSEKKRQVFTGETVAEGIFTNRFTESGSVKWIKIEVADKDDPTLVFVILNYKVDPSKSVNVYPIMPLEDGLSPISQEYARATGRGFGRVWAEGTEAIKGFKHIYTYGKGAVSMEVFASGYLHGQIDNGTLTDQYGNRAGSAISKQGNKLEGTPDSSVCFSYDEAYRKKLKLKADDPVNDSFFYAWVVNTKEDEASSYIGTAKIAPKEAGEHSYQTISLPMEPAGDEEDPVYTDCYVEAFFSRELYPEDNMGDMNSDGIPDEYATRRWSTDTGETKPICEAKTGQAISSGGEDSGGGMPSDLNDVSDYNGDEDFFPRAALSNPLDPSNHDWRPGNPFTAFDEIRGIGYGLNERGVSDYSLSDAEKYALLADYVAAGNPLTGGDDYSAAVNWAKTERWTPEAVSKDDERLNPLKKDTDNDGFDDGWEYFFWYYAKVGAVTNGVWGRLEGRHFNIASPAEGRRISPEDIVNAFDPHVKAPSGRDFDGDGLADFEEYVLGTNPCDWDSDRDGINDLWEVMNGLNPISWYDGSENPDCDFMAKCEYAEDTFTVFTFANGDIFGLPTATAPTFEVDPMNFSTNGWLVYVVKGAVTNAYVSVTPSLSEGAEAFPAGVTAGGDVYLKSYKPVVIRTPEGTEYIVADTSSQEYSLSANFYKAELYGSGEVVWFAGDKPKVFMRTATSLPRLAEDSIAFTTFTWNTNDYIGAECTLPVGTVLKSIDDTPTTITPVYVDPYMMDSGGISWINPQTQEREPTMAALPLFRYGGEGVTNYVPCALTVNRYSIAPVAPDAALVEMAGKDPNVFIRSPIVKVETGCPLTLIHNQVFKQYGFDPRTAWNVNDSGRVNDRWRGVYTRDIGNTGTATNTVKFTSLDEYYVMMYRQQMRKITGGVRSKSESFLKGGEIYLPEGSRVVDVAASVPYFRIATTYANVPVTTVRERVSTDSEGTAVPLFDTPTMASNENMSAWVKHLEDWTTHGADSDADGIPDGWELYVDADPNDWDDVSSDDDGDGLTLQQEYAGVDSCNAYNEHYDGSLICPEATTITKNHPGRASGWWNKFFPTDPHARDTDGDGLTDRAEGNGFKTDFYVGNNWYGDVLTSFIYGKDEHEAKYDADSDTVCFRGGGLNPCTVDTDGDLLPDAWEFQFAGIIFNNGSPVNKEVDLRDSDLQILAMEDGKQKAASGYEIRGGMDGTWGPYNGSNVDGDPCLDFDHDGLVNAQEYLVQALRHLRYDDDKTPLMGIDPNSKQFLKFIPFCAWDGEAFHKKCIESGFTGLGSWKFSELGYFTRPPHEWDMLAQDKEGIASCANYAPAGYRVMLPIGVGGYGTTDPRRWDSDEDGMDDYYELFHGLNPLLGTAGSPDANDEYGWPNTRYDVIARAYGSSVNAWRNFWTGHTNTKQPAFDAIRYPWMMGTMECDADGDGLRNDEESIKVNLAKPQNTHTDPTPLWMTDSTSTDKASYTAQYYAFDPYISETPNYDPNLMYPDVLGYPWKDITLTWRLRGMGASGESQTWMFSFEENEGYDTDHDFKRDAVELVQDVEMVSDPKMFSDPDRRQALYFPGNNSAATSYDGQFRRAASSEPDFFKQFTVECWAKPDGANRDAVLVERICNYGPSTLSNNTSVLRANFRVGIDGDGRAYGEFEGTTANSTKVRVTSPIVLESGAWTHIAFTFDGVDAALYLNGAHSPVAKVSNVELIPANGVMGIQQEYYTSVVEYGYITMPCATVLGADAVSVKAIALDKTTKWTDFSSFFKGWIDEVRIWDGARSANEIHDSYMKRFTMDDVKAMRTNSDKSGVFDKWFSGARRATGDLPAELIQHYSFTTLPGGVEPQNVLTEPTGFQENVFDNVRKSNGRMLDSSLLAGWWSTTPVHSTVYWNYAVIPWIGNTVAHLPFLDGSSADSQYWSEGLAGVILPSKQGFISYDYPNTANPYPYYHYHRERHNRLNLLGMVAMDEPVISSNSESTDYRRDPTMWDKWQFQLRSEFIGTSDLVPLGGAFAKRDTDFWDGQGAMDAWVETSADGELVDSNGNGIPDWAEELDYETVPEYLAALREGLLPTGEKDSAYRDRADANNNGIADWWERNYGLSNFDLREDSDRDGLSVAAEYSVVDNPYFDGALLDPTKAATDGVSLDYFRRFSNGSYFDGWYFGEVLSDHDFIEDWWEDLFSVDAISRYVYDALKDYDGDGWSNWAERRAGTDPSAEASLSLVSSSSGDDNVLPGYPVPLIPLSITYDSKDSISAGLVVKAWKGSAPSGIPDAVWTVGGSDDATVRHTRFIGYNPNRVVTLNLGPGTVAEGSLKLEFFDPTFFTRTTEFDTNHTVTASSDTAHYADSSHWYGVEGFVDTPSSDSTSDIGTFPSGTINYRTGDITIDFTQWQDPDYTWIGGEYSALKQVVNHYKQNKSYVRISWMSRLIGTGLKREIYLSTPDEKAVSRGHLREGKNTFIAFADANGNGEWDVGEAFGMVKDVDVGWGRVMGLTLSLTSESAMMPRLSVAEVEGKMPVRITRTTINGDPTASRVVFNRVIDFKGRKCFSEADLVQTGKFDLDWTMLTRDAKMANIQADDIVDVGYSVTIGEPDSTNGVYTTSFKKVFPANRAAPIAVRPSTKSGASSIIRTARPEFVWAGDAGYTAFVLEIATEPTADAVVWSSGINLLPATSEEGYVYRAPVYVGNELEDGQMYYWRVAQLNAKWPTTKNAAAWSEWSEFVTLVNSSNCDTGYGRLSVDVRYYGASEYSNNVIVAAYATPDFSGVPEAVLRLPESNGPCGGSTDLAITDNSAGFAAPCPNNLVTFDGLKPGSYYVMAFIDRNGNGKRDAFETWGYANFVGRNAESMYDPMAFTVSATALQAPAAVVFMEDTDVNQNEHPDWDEELESVASAAADASTSDDGGTSGSGSSSAANPLADTDGDGLPDSWEVWAGTDPYIADADLVETGDVMAYAVTNWVVVTLRNDSGSYVVCDGKKPLVGDRTDGLKLAVAYTYGDALGVGAVTNIVGDTVAVVSSSRPVALIHAQVFAEYGFSTFTANNESFTNGTAVFTKPFTALDKFLLIRYFANLGLCDEKAVIKSGDFASYSLTSANAPDDDDDGIADGWELYTMFGTTSLDGVVPDYVKAGGLAAAKISPFNPLDSGLESPAGDGLRLIEEWNRGHFPTNPWVSDTDDDGVSDSMANAYHLNGSDSLGDFDNDGLPNYAEYLVSKVFKFGDISPTNAYSIAGRLDYFRKSGRLYLGEMFSDHDFMEDDFEREWKVDPAADPGVYDAHIDSDEDGWSNWAEVRARYDMGYDSRAVGVNTNEVVESFNAWALADGSREITGWYSDWKARVDEIKAGTLNGGYEVQFIDADFVVEDWASRSAEAAKEPYGSGYIRYYCFIESPMKYPEHPQPVVKMKVRHNGAENLIGRTLVVQTYSGSEMKKVDAKFTVLFGPKRDVNELTLANPDEGYLREGMNTFVVSVMDAPSIMGVVRNVDVGWKGASCEVELSEISPTCPRLDLSSIASNETMHAYVYRYAVNGWEPQSAQSGGLTFSCVLDKDIGLRTAMNEGDFLSDTEFDVDWSRFYSEEFMGGPFGTRITSSGFSVTSVTYRVYSQPVEDIVAESINTNSTLPYVAFTRFFGIGRATAVPIAPGDDSTIFYTAQPTFRWKMTGEKPDTYTAFAIQVSDGSGAVVWNSGVQLAPPRNINGEYYWTAPLYVNDQASAGKVFANLNNYTWAVTMYNAKFQDDVWSDSRRFRMNVYGEGQSYNADSFVLNASVKYFGPGSVNADISKTSGILRVEAYTTPDFSGNPAGRTYIQNVASLTTDGQTVNATIEGLKAGSYYVRAFIDSDGDFKRSNWESWGYACSRGEADSAAIYAPKAVEVGYGLSPTAEVYVEDCDVDQDCLPDIYEYDIAGTDKTEFWLKNGPVENTHNVYVAVNPSLEAAISDLINGSNAGLRLFSNRGRMSASLAALMVGQPVVPTLDEKTLVIKSMTLADGEVKLVLGAEAELPEANDLFVTVDDGMVRATVVVKYAESLGGEWHSVEKYIEKKIEDGAVSEVLSFSLEELGLDASKGFFKVELKQ